MVRRNSVSGAEREGRGLGLVVVGVGNLVGSGGWSHVLLGLLGAAGKAVNWAVLDLAQRVSVGS